MRKKQWIKKRHRIIRDLLFLILYPYTKWKYNIHIEKFKSEENRPYLVLYNHQTAFDQFFVGMSIKQPVYYLATEDIFSMGWISSLIRYLVAPIPIKKQTLDISAIRNCMRVANEGGTIAIAPEGNRTFSGKTEFINPSIASLAKKLGLPILLYRIEGGYGIHPRWSDVVRKGKMRSYVSEVIMPDEYERLSKEELFDRINEGLYVDEANDNHIFYHSRRAEFLERVLYVCPDCGLSSFKSRKDEIKCKNCGKIVTYDCSARLHGIGFDLPFSFVGEWYNYQKEYINQLEVTSFSENPIYKEKVALYEVVVYKKKTLIKKHIAVYLYGNRIVINKSDSDIFEFDFDKISAVTILGKNKLNIYADGKVYQIKGGKRFNALKYVHIYNRYKNISRGDAGGKFLGL